MQYRGFEYEIITQETAWHTWTAAGHLQIDEHQGTTLEELSGTEDNLTKQYTTKEEAQRVVKELVERHIDRSLQKRGKP